MLSKSIQILLITSLLTACGSQSIDDETVNERPDVSVNSSTVTVVTSSVSSSRSSSQAQSSSRSSTASVVAVVSSSTPISVASSSTPMVAVSSSSQAAVVVSSRSSSISSSRSSSRSSSISSSSRSSSISSSRSSSSTASSASAKTVTIQWSHPTQRENGNYLELNEIGGYDIRVRAAGSSTYTTYKINGNSTTSYSLNNYVSTMTVEIAVFDVAGLYSSFVVVN